jgi:hypothetical protein
MLQSARPSCSCQVPLLVGNAIKAAAKHSLKSPGMYAALQALSVLLLTAENSGYIENGAAAGAFGSSIRQQLQQAGLLQEMALVMAALATDRRKEAAALAASSADALSADIGRFTASSSTSMLQLAVQTVSLTYARLRALWGSSDQTVAANCRAWVGESSGHAEAAMQLCTAELRHASSVLQHVLPAVKQKVPQQAIALAEQQYEAAAAAMKLGRHLAEVVPHTQLHQSPHCLPCVASVLALSAQWLNRVSEYGRMGGREAAGSRSSVLAMAINSLSDCQMALMQLLGFGSQLGAMAQLLTKPDDITPMFKTVTAACSRCYSAAAAVVSQGPPGPEAKQQRWGFQQTLWLLLPPMLLQCANNFLLQMQAEPGYPPNPEQWEEDCVAGLLEQSGQAVFAASRLHNWLGGELLPAYSDVVQEVLDGVLQLAAGMVLKRQLTQIREAVAAPAGDAPLGPAACSSLDNSTPTAAANPSSGRSLQNRAWARCAAESASLLAVLVHESHKWLLGGSSSVLTDPSSSTAETVAPAGLAAATPPSGSPVAVKFYGVCTVLEAGLRAVKIAAQRGTLPGNAGLINMCMHGLFLGEDDGAHPPLMRHMGRCGLAAVVEEQRCFYSLLSTLQKLGSPQTGPTSGLCWGQQVANTCWWATAQAAVGLLQAAAPVVIVGSAGAETIMVQQPEDEFLPSLVIFGRCCLAWAEQLQQQRPQLLAIGADTQQQQQQQPQQHQQQQQGGMLELHSAAYVCHLGLQMGAAATAAPRCMLRALVAGVGSWVGSVRSPAAQSALAAAAGGDLHQLKQQLEAVLAAQHAVWEGPCATTLAAFVEQLQATGVMPSSVAVLLFCNNPQCDNISGPTETQLVVESRCVCLGCRTALYCGRRCQEQHRPQHMPVCKALTAAAAATTTARV